MHTVDAQHFDVGDGRDPGGAWAVIQHCYFPENIARLRGFENDLLAFIVAQKDFDLAGADDVKGVAGIAEVENGFSGGVAEQVNAFGQGGSFDIGELAQVGNFGENRWIRGHGTTLQQAGGGRQKAEGRRQKAEGRRQKAEGRRRGYIPLEGSEIYL